MANTDSTQVLELLGQTVSLVHHLGGDTEHTGRVLAVVVPLPDVCVGTSILVDLPRGPEYFDLDDCTLRMG
jgi:hypothetical protein